MQQDNEQGLEKSRESLWGLGRPPETRGPGPQRAKAGIQD